MALDSKAYRAMESLLGKQGILIDPVDRKLYEYDGGVHMSIPDVVVFPRTTEEVVGLVKIAAEFKLPLVGRGAGTGLSGGAIALSGGMMISFARMNRLLGMDIDHAL